MLSKRGGLQSNSNHIAWESRARPITPPRRIRIVTDDLLDSARRHRSVHAQDQAHDLGKITIGFDGETWHGLPPDSGLQATLLTKFSYLRGL
jgi:hypothetical protein